jgi:hypothetical protein
MVVVASLRWHFGILICYLGLALWLTWPTALGFTTHYYSGGEQIFFYPETPDAPQNIWNFWMAERALRAGRSPLTTELLYYPEGVQMILQTLNLVAVLPAAPVTAMLGPTAAYNLTAIIAVALTGYAGFLLARAFAPGLVGPGLAGALLTASPFHMAKLDSGQLNFVTMQWLVFFMLAFVLLARPQGNAWRAAGLAGLAFAAVLYTDWYWTLSAVLFGMLWAGLSLVGARRALALALLGRYTRFALLAVLSALPLVMALRSAANQSLGEAENPIWAIYRQAYSADGLGLFFPAARHPLWAAPVERFLLAVAPFGVTEGSYTAAGWTLAGLGLLGAFWYGRGHWRLLVVGAVAWLLALGPSLYVLGYATGIAMPYRLLQLLPLIETARRPNLFGVVTIVVVAIFAALALAGLRERLPQRRYGLVLGLLAALALFELWPGLRVANALARDPVYERIAAEAGVVVDLPLEAGTDSRTLINQIVHGQPIIRGYVARPPVYTTLLYSPLVQQLARMQPWPEEDIVALDAAALARMQCYYQLRYVVLEHNQLAAAQLAAVETLAERLGSGTAQLWYDDGRHRAYQLPLHEDRCAPFVFLGAGWHSLEQGDADRWRWTQETSEIYIVNPHPEPLAVVLGLHAEAPEAGRTLEIVQDDQVRAHFALVRAIRRYQIGLSLAPGLNRITFEVKTNRDPYSERDLGFVVKWIKISS